MTDKKKIRTIDLLISDSTIYNLSEALIDVGFSMSKGEDIALTLNTEGPCLRSLTYRVQDNLLKLLDKCCDIYGYDRKKLQIVTANLIEDTTLWPNIQKINTGKGWFFGHKIKVDQPKHFKYHFGSFVSNSTWPRLLIGSHLYCNHKDKTFQTFRRNPKISGHAVNLDLDKLMFNCLDEDVLTNVSNFIKNLPLEKALGLAEHPKTNVSAGEDGDALNKNILGWYSEFFCDVVTETFFSGRSFCPTEKTTRPLLTANPFLLQGPIDFLKNLRRLGFKTFSAYWDESYDHWQGYAGRAVRHRPSRCRDDVATARCCNGTG